MIIREVGVDGASKDGGEKGDEKASQGEYGGCDVEYVDFRSRLKQNGD